jgi:hypothetical protein
MPTGFGADRGGRRKRVYDTPATPLDRLLAADLERARQLSRGGEATVPAGSNGLSTRVDLDRLSAASAG